MGTINQPSITDENLDHLAEFLGHELERPSLAVQIPDGAHIFHGSHDDMALTRANLQLASKILLGITLGYIQDAPLVMVFEHKSGSQTVIDLSDKIQKDKARTFVQGFQEQSQNEMVVKINELVSA